MMMFHQKFQMIISRFPQLHSESAETVAGHEVIFKNRCHRIFFKDFDNGLLQSNLILLSSNILFSIYHNEENNSKEDFEKAIAS